MENEAKIYVPKEFWQFQREGVRQLILHKKTILADDMGLGKTGQALVAWKNLPSFISAATFKFLVVCPNRASYQWLNQIRRWWPEMEAHTYMHIGKPHERIPRLLAYLQDPKAILITNYALFRTSVKLAEKARNSTQEVRATLSPESLFPLYYDAVCFDEAHELKNRNSQNFECAKIISRPNWRLHLLTGSPMSRGPQDLWALLNLCYPYEYGSYWSFVKLYTEVEHNGYGLHIGQARNSEALRKRISSFFIRRTKKEVMDQMPPKVRGTLSVQMTERQKKQYQQMLEASVLALNDEGMPIDWEEEEELADHKYLMAAPIVIAQLSRLQTLLICPKMLAEDELQESLFDYGGAIEGIVQHVKESEIEPHFAIFTPFSRALKYFKQYLEQQGFENVHVIKGGMNPKKLIETADLVKATRGIALVSIKTGTSWDLETCPVAYFVSMDYDPQMNFQAEDRLDRMSRTGTCNIYYTHYEYTLDDTMIEIVLNKQQNVLSVLKTPQDLITLLKGN